jgi:glycosyltransferase involved in cell wall biosynthesis
LSVSLIITTYNKPEYLKKVIAGVLLQRVLPHEIIIADDGSDEKTKKVVEEFRSAAACPVLHVWHEDLGFRAAKIRNEAVKRANGDYIIFLDGDCVPGRHFLSDHVSLAEEGFFYQGKRLLLTEAGSRCFDASRAGDTGFLFQLFVKGRLSHVHHLLRAPLFPAFSNRSLRGVRSCNIGIYRKDLIAVNGFNQDFVGWGREDSELVARLYKYGLRRKTHPFMAVCFHLWHEENARDRLAQNDKLLREALESSDYRCRNGIEEEVPA